MILLIIGLLVFSIVHIAIGLPGMRVKLHHRFGPWMVRLVVTTGSLVGLLIMIKGYSWAQFYPLWAPLAFGKELASVLMPVAMVLLVAAYVPNHLKRYTAHPMLWGVVLWAVSHLAVRGDLASLILFGGLGSYALIAMGLAFVRGVRPSEQSHAMIWDGVTVLLGLTVYGALLVFHPNLFGVSVFS